MIARRREMRLTPELVARVAYVGDPGPIRSGLRLTVEADHEVVIRNILEGRPATGDVWIFAYGSLIWRPDFDFVERRIGRLHGWHRSFCLGWDRRLQGSTERPGLMMALDRGGECKSVVYELPKEEVGPNLAKLIPREMPFTPATLLPR
jgi:cation transport protein ChaC